MKTVFAAKTEYRSTVVADLPGMREPLRPADRSDALNATQALVRVVKGAKYLDFDGHSYSRHEVALLAQGWTVEEDLRHTLMAR